VTVKEYQHIDIPLDLMIPNVGLVNVKATHLNSNISLVKMQGYKSTRYKELLLIGAYLWILVITTATTNATPYG
jgi:hypothetical protein